MSNSLRLALFISGSGTTAEAILLAVKKGILAIDPVLVIASKIGIAGIDRVKNVRIRNLQVEVVDPKKIGDKNIFAEKLIDKCKTYKVDLIGQYGWLPLTPKKFVKAYEERILNQHCGPLDPPREGFGGKGMWGRRVHCAVLYFRRVTNHYLWTEATTHLVTSEFDKGAVVKRKRINILPTDTVEELQKRVKTIEHQVQIDLLQDFIKGIVRRLKRDVPLISKNEFELLIKAKKIASILYPNG